MVALKLLQDQPTNKKKWALVALDDEKEKLVKIIDIDLISSSLTNRFDIVANLFDDLCKLIPDDFIPWYTGMMTEYMASDYNSEVIVAHTQNFIDIADKYIVAKNVNFSSFVDYKKASKTSIIFTVDDLWALAQASVCLKMYSLIGYDSVMKLPDNSHKIIYSAFIQRCQDCGTTTKIYQTMRSRTYKSSMTDRYMWDLIKMMVVETPESYSLLIFNFLLNNLLSTLDITANPISFIVSVIDDSIGWMIRGVYKDKILYSEMFGGSADIYGTGMSKDSLNIYCCNDVIGKAAKAGMEILENEYCITQDDFREVQDRLDRIVSICTSMNTIILPIASKVLDIPYKYLLTSPPKHIMLLGVLLHQCSKDILDDRFPIIHEFLLAAPVCHDTSVRSSYKIKNLRNILNENQYKIFGFNSRALRYNIMSMICGKLYMNKKDLVSLVDGDPLQGINYAELENDIVIFFSELYSGQLNNMLASITKKVDTYF